MKNSTFKIVAALVAFIAIVLFVRYAGTSIGLSATITQQLLVVMPGVFVFFLGVGMLIKVGTGVFALPAFATLGIGLAILLGSIQTGGLYPIETIGGATLQQVQLLVITMASLVGGMVAALSRGK